MILQGDAGSPLVMCNKVIGIATIVNIRESRNPIIFIHIHHIIQFIDKLKEDFPDENTSNSKDQNELGELENSNEGYEDPDKYSSLE